MTIDAAINALDSAETKVLFAELYGGGDAIFTEQKRRYSDLIEGFRKRFGDRDIGVFSSPGRERDMVSSGDWLPPREQDLVELCTKWKAGMGKPENAAAFGWKQAEVDETLVKVDGFLMVQSRHYRAVMKI